MRCRLGINDLDANQRCILVAIWVRAFLMCGCPVPCSDGDRTAHEGALSCWRDLFISNEVLLRKGVNKLKLDRTLRCMVGLYMCPQSTMGEAVGVTMPG